MSQSWIKIASSFLLAICFYSHGISQDFRIDLNDSYGLKNRYYLEVGKQEQFCIGNYSGILDTYLFKSCKVKGKKMRLDDIEVTTAYAYFDMTPTETGVTTLKAKVKFTNGEKRVIQRTVEIVDLPDLCLEVSVSSPDHKFIWLKLREENGGKDVSQDYEIVRLHYKLQSANGSIKEENTFDTDEWFFPSISLQKLSSQFELEDKLIITLSVIHKHYELITTIAPTTLIIDKLWN